MSTPHYDILIRGATLVGAHEMQRGDLAIKNGTIAAMGENLEGSAVHLIEQAHYFVLPGHIDAHVHLNEPGREDWEGFATGTSALAAGGCTAFIDMPLNSTPVLDTASFEAKAACLRKSSRLNGALWGGLVPGHERALPELAACGVVGFKAFMSNSGMDDFPRADRETLREGMSRSAELGLPVAVHAESDAMTGRLARERQSQGRCSIRDYLDSRPIAAELEAIGEALVLSRETGCALHVVHVSSAAGLELIHEARLAGGDVTAETCPHYLLLDEDDVLRIGPAAKCAPPLRPAAERERLWEALRQDRVDTLGSDHSPSPPELKISKDFFQVWGGIAGAQHGYPLLFEEMVLRRGLPAEQFARLTALNVARRFHLARKGDLRVGWDADLVLLEETGRRTITPEELLSRHPISPYVGRSTSVRVALTLSGGEIIHGPARDVRRQAARILRPSRSK